MTVYMKMDGISGSVTDRNYKDWIEVHDIEFCGVSQRVNSPIGRQQDRISTHPAFGDFSIVKSVDTSTIDLLSNVATGQVIPNVEIDYVTTGNPNYTFLKYKLKNVLITHYSNRESSGQHMPIEEISLNYESIESMYYKRETNNTQGTPVRFGYDLANATKL